MTRGTHLPGVCHCAQLILGVIMHICIRALRGGKDGGEGRRKGGGWGPARVEEKKEWINKTRSSIVIWEIHSCPPTDSKPLSSGPQGRGYMRYERVLAVKRRYHNILRPGPLRELFCLKGAMTSGDWSYTILSQTLTMEREGRGGNGQDVSDFLGGHMRSILQPDISPSRVSQTFSQNREEVRVFFPYKFCKPTSKRDIVLLRVNERGCCFHPFYTFFFYPCSPASVDRFPSTCWRKVLPAKSEKVRESAFELQRTIYKRLASPVSFFPACWRERTRTNTLETKNFGSTETSHTMSQSNESIVAARGRWE